MDQKINAKSSIFARLDAKIAKLQKELDALTQGVAGQPAIARAQLGLVA